MAPVRQAQVKQLQPRQQALRDEERVVTVVGKGGPVASRAASKQLPTGRDAAGKNALSTSTVKSRAAAASSLPTTQVAKSTASSAVNRNNAAKKADKAEVGAGGAGARRVPVIVRKSQPSPQSSQSSLAAVRHDILLRDRNIQRTDTLAVREVNLAESSAHRSVHLSDQRERGARLHAEREQDIAAAEQQEEQEELASQEYSDDFDDYESDFEEEEQGEEDDDEHEDRKVVETDHRPEDCESQDERQEIVEQGNWLSEGSLIRLSEAEEEQKKRISISSSAAIGIIDPDVPEIETGDQLQLLSSSSSGSRSRRQRDLSSVIKLNAVTYQIYSHPGISYDVYMRMFGRKNHRQLATQTNERQDESIQSEMFLTKENWMQHPFYSYSVQQDKPFYHSNTRALVQSDPFRLLSFLRRCEKMLNILIKDSSTRIHTPNFPDSGPTKSARRVMKLPAGSEKFCAQFHKLIGMSSLKKYPISLIHAESSSSLIISVQVNPDRDESFLLIWPGSDACRPDHVLHARSHVTCCHWTGDDRVVAGTRDGSLLVWEWREERNKIDVESGCFVPGEPAFASSCVTSLDVHQSCIVSIDAMDRQEEGAGNPDQRCRRIVVVDEDALISFWIVEVVVVKQSEMGDGMFPGSKCKLLLEATTRIDASSRVTFMCSAQDDAACFFVGTDVGLIHETSQFHDARSPITYSPIRDADSPLSAVSSVSLNPAERSLFLTSFDDGTISLFRRRGPPSAETHLMTWDSTDTHITSAIAVHWLPACPSAFVALSASSSLLFWDLDTFLWNPLFKYELTKVTCMSMTDEKDAGMAFGTEDGNTEIMTLTPQFRTRKDMGRVIAKLMNEEHINQV